MDRREVESRRANNQIWNGAGDYGLRPQFQVYGKDGRAALYFNTVIGLLYRTYDYKKLSALFYSFREQVNGELYTDLFWLGLERCVYLKHREERPVLEKLRRDYARQMVEKARAKADRDTLESLRTAWFCRILGEEPEESAWETGLLDRLEFSVELDTDGVRQQMEDLLYEYFRRPRRSVLDELGGSRVNKGFFATWHVKHTSGDALRRLDMAGGAGRSGGGLLQKRFAPFWQTKTKEAALREYITNCFGVSMLPEAKRIEAEKLLCTGGHRHCRLHFTKGLPPKNPGAARERAAFQAQRERNRAYFQNHLVQNRLLIQKLAQGLQNTILLQMDVSEHRTQAGVLQPSLAWRSGSLGERNIFLQRQQNEPGQLSVDILLDASASQSGQQEKVAVQGYLIAAALTRCQIPVRVAGFCSVSGCTVLRVFRDYQETDRNEMIFDYVSAGWNRDGLALRAMRWLMAQSSGDRRLLIVLTDASPNDDQKFPTSGFLRSSRDYRGKAAVEDTAAEAAALRRQGVTVLCVFTGGDRELPAARMIYGRDMVRVPAVGWFADTVGKLIQSRLAEL